MNITSKFKCSYIYAKNNEMSVGCRKHDNLLALYSFFVFCLFFSCVFVAVKMDQITLNEIFMENKRKRIVLYLLKLRNTQVAVIRRMKKTH